MPQTLMPSTNSKPVIDHVSDTFKDMYTQSVFVSVDEAMIPYTCRKIREFMNNKPVKKGIKVWMCCDSTNAYCHKFDVYLRKTGTYGTWTWLQRGKGHDQ